MPQPPMSADDPQEMRDALQAGNGCLVVVLTNLSNRSRDVSQSEAAEGPRCSFALLGGGEFLEGMVSELRRDGPPGFPFSVRRTRPLLPRLGPAAPHFPPRKTGTGSGEVRGPLKTGQQWQRIHRKEEERHKLENRARAVGACKQHHELLSDT